MSTLEKTSTELETKVYQVEQTLSQIGSNVPQPVESTVEPTEIIDVAPQLDELQQ